MVTHAVADFESKIKRTEKNRISQALLALAATYPNEGPWEIDKLPASSPSPKTDGALAKTGANAMAPNVIGVELVGEQRHLMLNESNPVAMALAETMSGMNGIELHSALVSVSRVTRAMPALNTAWASAFVISNFVRDIPAAVLNLHRKPLKGNRWKLTKKVGPAIEGIRPTSAGVMHLLSMYRVDVLYMLKFLVIWRARALSLSETFMR